MGSDLEIFERSPRLFYVVLYTRVNLDMVLLEAIIFDDIMADGNAARETVTLLRDES